MSEVFLRAAGLVLIAAVVLTFVALGYGGGAWSVRGGRVDRGALAAVVAGIGGLCALGSTAAPAEALALFILAASAAAFGVRRATGRTPNHPATGEADAYRAGSKAP